MLGHVRTFCDSVPNDDFKVSCNDYGGRAIQAVSRAHREGISPRDECMRDFPGCSTRDVEPLGMVCSTCKGVMVGLKALVKSGIGEKALLDAGRAACSILPMYRDKCRGWIDAYGPSLIDWLLKYSAKDVCKKVKAC
jgi:hypothetical protein